MTPLREAELAVAYWTRACDKAHDAWWKAKRKPPSVRWSLFGAYELAQQKLNAALHERDVLRAKLGVHPFMNLTPRTA